jgi:hypothetical protein
MFIRNVPLRRILAGASEKRADGLTYVGVADVTHKTHPLTEPSRPRVKGRA